LASDRLARSLLAAPDPAAWDGRWLLVLVRPDATDDAGDTRAFRQAIQVGLGFEGFGLLGGGLWISADPRAEAGARVVLAKAGAGARSAVFLAELTEPADIAQEAWDLEAGAAAHRRFLDRFADKPPAQIPVDPSAAFATATRLGHEWQELLRDAPDLPHELLPADWPGRASRERFIELYGRNVGPARDFYIALTDDALV